MAFLFSLLCCALLCVCFVLLFFFYFLRPVFCVPDIASVSRLSILDVYFCYANVYCCRMCCCQLYKANVHIVILKTRILVLKQLSMIQGELDRQNERKTTVRKKFV